MVFWLLRSTNEIGTQSKFVSFYYINFLNYKDLFSLHVKILAVHFTMLDEQ